MTLRARLILVKRVPAGSGVSYEHDYVTDRDTTLALVPLGYADGLPWGAARHAEVSIAGRRYPVAGRIAMDQFVVDVGDATPRIGDEVVVFGPGTEGEPTVADWARWADTVPHEIITGIGPRVARRYAHDRGVVACLSRRSDSPSCSVDAAVSTRCRVESAASILASLDRDRYEVLPVRIGRDGVWASVPAMPDLPTVEEVLRWQQNGFPETGDTTLAGSILAAARELIVV